MKKYITTFVLLIILTSGNVDKKDEINILFGGIISVEEGVSDKVKLESSDLLSEAIKRYDTRDFFAFDCNGAYIKKKLSIDSKNNILFITPGDTCTLQIYKRGNYKYAIISASLVAKDSSLLTSNIEQLKNSIKNFQKKSSFIPLVLYINWDMELQAQPEKWQEELVEDLLLMGVDAIIGCHASITQTIDFVNNIPVFYSIGNFNPDIDLSDTGETIIVNLSVTDKIDGIKIIPIKGKDHFKKKINRDNDYSTIKACFSCSNNISAICLEDSWLVKPIQQVNFQERSDFWMFISKKKSASVKRLKSGSHLLTYYSQNDTSNTICLHGQLSEFQFSDINNDGKEDLLLGISKRVIFDPTFKKRINIYSYRNNNLQTLWLGTRFIYDIESFDVYRAEGFNYLSIIEVDTLGNKFQGIYEWDDFGFALQSQKKIYTDEN